MGDAAIIEFLLGILEILGSNKSKRKNNLRLVKGITEDSDKIIRNIKEQVSPFVESIEDVTRKDGTLGIILYIKPQRRPPEKIDIFIESKKIEPYIIKYLSVVTRSNVSTYYALEIELQDPVRSLIKEVRGLKTIEIGDKEIDRKFIIRTNDANLTKHLFENNEIRKYFNSISGLMNLRLSPESRPVISIEMTYTKYNVIYAYNLIKQLIEFTSLHG